MAPSAEQSSQVQHLPAESLGLPLPNQPLAQGGDGGALQEVPHAFYSGKSNFTFPGVRAQQRSTCLLVEASSTAPVHSARQEDEDAASTGKNLKAS